MPQDIPLDALRPEAQPAAEPQLSLVSLTRERARTTLSESDYAVTAVSIGLGKTIVSAISPGLSTLIQPNHADTSLTGAAVMAPLGGRYKAAAIGGALAIGRVVNYFLQSDNESPDRKIEPKSL